MKQIKEMCEGCAGLDEKVTCFVKVDFDTYDDCPCRNCIIKPICSERCEERVSYYFDKKEEYYGTSNTY